MYVCFGARVCVPVCARTHSHTQQLPIPTLRGLVCVRARVFVRV